MPLPGSWCGDVFRRHRSLFLPRKEASETAAAPLYIAHRRRFTHPYAPSWADEGRQATRGSKYQQAPCNQTNDSTMTRTAGLRSRL